jgi:hypothetical protein
MFAIDKNSGMDHIYLSIHVVVNLEKVLSRIRIATKAMVSSPNPI